MLCLSHQEWLFSDWVPFQRPGWPAVGGAPESLLDPGIAASLLYRKIEIHLSLSILVESF
ncbi:MAG: hypothetical protein Fur0032_13870 [Terrimicrobiaceae bacterium]